MNKDFLLGLDPKFAEALEEFVLLFNMNSMRWIANLWDPDTGGFYYSISARDHEGFGADLESTAQILRVVESRGMPDAYGGIAKAMPKDIVEKLIGFADSCLSDDGYFYHPQWGKNIGTTRRGRDLQWGRIIYNMFEKTPPRKTAVELLQKSESASAAVTTLPEHLKNKKNLLNYLESQYQEKSSYPLGNLLNSQMVQIKAAGLLDECCKFLDSKQNLKNGLWEPEVTYRSISGLMKVSAIYINAGRRINHTEKISESIFSLLKSKEKVDQIVYVYNPISALSQQIYMLKLTDESFDAAKLICRLKENAYDIVLNSIDKVREFSKPDGSYSYSPEFSASRSQNVPTALKDSREGDVNATTIVSGGVISLLLENLGISAKTFDENDFEEFISIMRSQKSIVKHPAPQDRMP